MTTDPRRGSSSHHRPSGRCECAAQRPRPPAGCPSTRAARRTADRRRAPGSEQLPTSVMRMVSHLAEKPKAHEKHNSSYEYRQVCLVRDDPSASRALTTSRTDGGATDPERTGTCWTPSRRSSPSSTTTNSPFPTGSSARGRHWSPGWPPRRRPGRRRGTSAPSRSRSCDGTGRPRHRTASSRRISSSAAGPWRRPATGSPAPSSEATPRPNRLAVLMRRQFTRDRGGPRKPQVPIEDAWQRRRSPADRRPVSQPTDK